MDALFDPRHPFGVAEFAARPVGILYAEDFDDSPDARPTQTDVDLDSVSEPSVPVITPTDVEQACLRAVTAARAEWQHELDVKRTIALEAVATAIDTARREAALESAVLAEGTVTTMLSMLAGALPRFCRDHGPSEVRALVARLLPNLRSQARISLRVHASLVDTIEDDIAKLETELAGTITVIAAPIEVGDVRVNWENGSLKRDTAAILTAIDDALAQLGLLRPIEITPERRMELAK